MINIALITAGGIGSRTHQNIPKQFISVNDKPIILYTLENFQKHPEIDKIVVVCLEGWENCLKSYARQFGITKLESVTIGGTTGFESIVNGLNEIKKFAFKDDIILIHDGNRPGVTADIITNCINLAKTKGNAITGIPVSEVVFEKDNDNIKLLNRDRLIRIQTPHAAPFSKMINLYEKAEQNDKTDLLGFCSLLYEFKEPINFVNGNEINFKITYKEDIDLFKGLIKITDDKD